MQHCAVILRANLNEELGYQSGLNTFEAPTIKIRVVYEEELKLTANNTRLLPDNTPVIGRVGSTDCPAGTRTMNVNLVGELLSETLADTISLSGVVNNTANNASKVSASIGLEAGNYTLIGNATIMDTDTNTTNSIAAQGSFIIEAKDSPDCGNYGKIIINVPANPGAHIIQLGCEQLTEIKPDVPISVSVADSDDLIASVDISGVISGSATKPGDTWTFSDVAEQLSAGEYIITVTATYSDGSTETQSKSFTVLLDERSPSDGCNVNKTIALVSYSAHLSGDPVRVSSFGQVPVEWRQRCSFSGSYIGRALPSGLPNYRDVNTYGAQKYLYYTDDGSSVSDDCIEAAESKGDSMNLFPHLSSDWQNCEGVFNDSKCTQLWQ